MQRLSLSSAVFAATVIAIGIWGFAQNAFVAIWAPGIQPTQFRPSMVIVCSLISVIGGAGLLLKRYELIAARLLLAFLFIWLVWCKGIALMLAPTELASFESVGETAVVISATWALAKMPGSKPGDRRANLSAKSGPRIAFGLALIAFGASHLGYVSMTQSLVPAWLPSRVSWVYLTGATYIAAGSALVAGRLTMPAAALSTLQMAIFTILVWFPKLASGARDAETLNETAISFTLAVSGWVILTLLARRSHEVSNATHLMFSARS